jgi:hypothetical protein
MTMRSPDCFKHREKLEIIADYASGTGFDPHFG